jgi:hypothetical protein
MVTQRPKNNCSKLLTTQVAAPAGSMLSSRRQICLCRRKSNLAQIRQPRHVIVRVISFCGLLGAAGLGKDERTAEFHYGIRLAFDFSAYS